MIIIYHDLLWSIMIFSYIFSNIYIYIHIYTIVLWLPSPGFKAIYTRAPAAASEGAPLVNVAHNFETERGCCDWLVDWLVGWLLNFMWLSLVVSIVFRDSFCSGLFCEQRACFSKACFWVSVAHSLPVCPPEAWRFLMYIDNMTDVPVLFVIAEHSQVPRIRHDRGSLFTQTTPIIWQRLSEGGDNSGRCRKSSGMPSLMAWCSSCHSLALATWCTRCRFTGHLFLAETLMCKLTWVLSIVWIFMAINCHNDIQIYTMIS